MPEDSTEPATQPEDPTPPSETVVPPTQENLPTPTPPQGSTTVRQDALRSSFYSGAPASSIPESFRSSNMIESNLLGFTLPLLNTFEEQWQAALVFETIRHVGEAVRDSSIEEWLTQMIVTVTGEQPSFSTRQTVLTDALEPGDWLFES